MNMTPEEMNTQLYEKLTAEQAKYRDWLMGQPPEEILNHAYEYAVREDILAAAELMDLSLNASFMVGFLQTVNGSHILSPGKQQAMLGMASASI